MSSMMSARDGGRAMCPSSPILYNSKFWRGDDKRRNLLLYRESDQYYFCDKYQNPTTREEYAPIIRYAEVLLNYTEAVYERYAATDGSITDESKVDAALKYLNEVRKRVNPDMPNLTVSFAATKGLSLREEIRRERTVELFNEGFRIDDLKRWKTAEVEMPKNMLGVKWSTTGDWSTWATAWKPSYSTDTDDAGIAGCLMIETDRVWENRTIFIRFHPIRSN